MAITWAISGIYKADPEKVYSEIFQDGQTETTPEQVLERAKDKKSELHKCFEWNNTKAAEKYRLLQAGQIIRMLKVDVRDIAPNAEPNEVRAIVSTGKVNTYEPMTVCIKNPDAYSHLLVQAKVEMETFKRKYGTLAELEAVIQAMNSVA